MTREEQRTELLVHRIKDNCFEVAKKLLDEHDKQIRADTIDECIAKIDRDHKHSAYSDDVYEAIMLLEQLKKRDTKVKIDNKPNPPMPKDYGELKIINHPKYIIVNGALYEKIDDSVLTIANGYGDLI